MDKSSMRGGATVVSGKTDAEGVETVTVSSAKPETIERSADGSITVHLQHPFLRPPQSGKDIMEGVDKIVLREMTAGDLIDMDKGESDTDKSVALAAALSGQPMSAIKRLHFEDFAAVHAVINQKLGKFLRISARVLSSWQDD